MNSKEALETIGMTKTNNIKSESLSKPRVMYLVKELRKKEIQTIKQDLDRLEKLEKENKVLLVNKNVAQGIAKKLKEENDKLKKALDKACERLDYTCIPVEEELVEDLDCDNNCKECWKKYFMKEVSKND